MRSSSILFRILLAVPIALTSPLFTKYGTGHLTIDGSSSAPDIEPFLWKMAYPEPGKAKIYRAIEFTELIDDISAPVDHSTLDLDILDFHTPPDLPANLDPTLLKTPKYFIEQGSDPHVAAGFDISQDRVAKTRATNAVIRAALQHLARNLTEFSIAHNWVYWLAHGTLLGESWGSKILSFDDDLDVQTSYLGLYKMLPQHNKIFNNRYLLQINPWFVQRLSLNNVRYTNVERMVAAGRMPEKNVIDARFLDIETGFFVDITALSAEAADDAWYDLEDGRSSASHDENLHDKSVHTYKFTDISPLHYCEFEGLSAWCPHHSDAIRIKEYQHASKNPHYKTFRYNAAIKNFEQLDCAALARMYTRPTAKACDSACRDIVRHERQIRWVKDGHAPDECLLNVRVTRVMQEGIELQEDFNFRGRRVTEEFPPLP